MEPRQGAAPSPASGRVHTTTIRSARAPAGTPTRSARAPRPPATSDGQSPMRRVDGSSTSNGGVVLPMIAPPPSGHGRDGNGGMRSSSPGASKRMVWTTPRQPTSLSGSREGSTRSLDEGGYYYASESDTGMVYEGDDMGNSIGYWNDGVPSLRANTASDYHAGHLETQHTMAVDGDQVAQLAYMENMYSSIELELENERVRTSSVEYQVATRERAALDGMQLLSTQTMDESDNFGLLGASIPLVSATSVPAVQTNRRFQPHQPRTIAPPDSSAVLAKEQQDLCAALGKNAELRIRSREMERQSENTTLSLEQTQRRLKQAERRVVNRENKLRALLKEKLQSQSEMKELKQQIVEEKMRQVDALRKLETTRRDAEARVESMEVAVRDAADENRVLRVQMSETKHQLMNQTKRADDLAMLAQFEKEQLVSSIAEARSKFKEWKEGEGAALKAQRDQAVNNLRAEYELKIARHHDEKQKLREKVKDLEVSVRLMQKDRSLSPLELSLRKATILGNKDNAGTSEAELIEAHARIKELEAQVQLSHEFQKRQENVIKVSETTISRLIQEREMAALDGLAKQSLPANQALLNSLNAHPDVAPYVVDTGFTATRQLSPRQQVAYHSPQRPSIYNSHSGIRADEASSPGRPRPATEHYVRPVAPPPRIVGMASPARKKSSERVAKPRQEEHDTGGRAVPPRARIADTEVSSSKEQLLMNELQRLTKELDEIKSRNSQNKDHPAQPDMDMKDEIGAVNAAYGKVSSDLDADITCNTEYNQPTIPGEAPVIMGAVTTTVADKVNSTGPPAYLASTQTDEMSPSHAADIPISIVNSSPPHDNPQGEEDEEDSEAGTSPSASGMQSFPSVNNSIEGNNVHGLDELRITGIPKTESVVGEILDDDAIRKLVETPFDQEMVGEKEGEAKSNRENYELNDTAGSSDPTSNLGLSKTEDITSRTESESRDGGGLEFKEAENSQRVFDMDSTGECQTGAEANVMNLGDGDRSYGDSEDAKTTNGNAILHPNFDGDKYDDNMQEAKTEQLLGTAAKKESEMDQNDALQFNGYDPKSMISDDAGESTSSADRKFESINDVKLSKDEADGVGATSPAMTSNENVICGSNFENLEAKAETKDVLMEHCSHTIDRGTIKMDDCADTDVSTDGADDNEELICVDSLSPFRGTGDTSQNVGSQSISCTKMGSSDSKSHIDFKATENALIDLDQTPDGSDEEPELQIVAKETTIEVASTEVTTIEVTSCDGDVNLESRAVAEEDLTSNAEDESIVSLALDACVARVEQEEHAEIKEDSDHCMVGDKISKTGLGNKSEMSSYQAENEEVLDDMKGDVEVFVSSAPPVRIFESCEVKETEDDLRATVPGDMLSTHRGEESERVLSDTSQVKPINALPIECIPSSPDEKDGTLDSVDANYQDASLATTLTENTVDLNQGETALNPTISDSDHCFDEDPVDVTATIVGSENTLELLSHDTGVCEVMERELQKYNAVGIPVAEGNTVANVNPMDEDACGLEALPGSNDSQLNPSTLRNPIDCNVMPMEISSAARLLMADVEILAIGNALEWRRVGAASLDTTACDNEEKPDMSSPLGSVNDSPESAGDSQASNIPAGTFNLDDQCASLSFVEFEHDHGEKGGKEAEIESLPSIDPTVGQIVSTFAIDLIDEAIAAGLQVATTVTASTLQVPASLDLSQGLSDSARSTGSSAASDEPDGALNAVIVELCGPLTNPEGIFEEVLGLTTFTDDSLSHSGEEPLDVDAGAEMSVFDTQCQATEPSNALVSLDSEMSCDILDRADSVNKTRSLPDAGEDHVVSMGQVDSKASLSINSGLLPRSKDTNIHIVAASVTAAMTAQAVGTMLVYKARTAIHPGQIETCNPEPIDVNGVPATAFETKSADNDKLLFLDGTYTRSEAMISSTEDCALALNTRVISRDDRGKMEDELEMVPVKQDAPASTDGHPIPILGNVNDARGCGATGSDDTKIVGVSTTNESNEAITASTDVAPAPKSAAVPEDVKSPSAIVKEPDLLDVPQYICDSEEAAEKIVVSDMTIHQVCPPAHATDLTRQVATLFVAQVEDRVVHTMLPEPQGAADAIADETPTNHANQMANEFMASVEAQVVRKVQSESRVVTDVMGDADPSIPDNSAHMCLGDPTNLAVESDEVCTPADVSPCETGQVLAISVDSNVTDSIIKPPSLVDEPPAASDGRGDGDVSGITPVPSCNESVEAGDADALPGLRSHPAEQGTYMRPETPAGYDSQECGATILSPSITTETEAILTQEDKPPQPLVIVDGQATGNKIPPPEIGIVGYHQRDEGSQPDPPLASTPLNGNEGRARSEYTQEPKGLHSTASGDNSNSADQSRTLVSSLPHPIVGRRMTSSRYASNMAPERIRDTTLMAYDVTHEQNQPFAMLDEAILNIDQNAHHLGSPEPDRTTTSTTGIRRQSQVQDPGVLVTKKKNTESDAHRKSIAFRSIPAFNYEPVLIKFQWSDFVVATPIRKLSTSSRICYMNGGFPSGCKTDSLPRTPSASSPIVPKPTTTPSGPVKAQAPLITSPVAKMRLLLKRGAKLPCHTYVIISVFIRPLEDGNENLRIHIYDSERVDEFQYDFHEDHLRDYVEDWTASDDQARAFVARLEFCRQQESIIIKMPEKIRHTYPPREPESVLVDGEPATARHDPAFSILSLMQATHLPPEPHYRLSPNASFPPHHGLRLTASLPAILPIASFEQHDRESTLQSEHDLQLDAPRVLLRAGTEVEETKEEVDL